MTTQHAKSNAREGDGDADHVAVLRELHAAAEFAVDRAWLSDLARTRYAAERDALDAAIAAMQAQQGAEPVAHRWLRNGEPQGQWVVGMPSPRQFQAASECAELATWTAEYAYAGAPRAGDAVNDQLAEWLREKLHALSIDYRHPRLARDLKMVCSCLVPLHTARLAAPSKEAGADRLQRARDALNEAQASHDPEWIDNATNEIEALESANPPGDQRQEGFDDWSSEVLTDGNGYAPADTWKACRKAFDSAWPQGKEAAEAAAQAAFDKLHPRKAASPPPEAAASLGTVKALPSLRDDYSEPGRVSLSLADFEKLRIAAALASPTGVDVLACHAIVSDECRNNRSNLGAANEAIGRMFDSATDLMEAWPIGKGAKLHFKLSVEYPRAALAARDGGAA